MNFLSTKTRVLCNLSIFCIFLITFAVTAIAEHDPLKGLSGPAFSDVSEKMDMPDTWKKQPVKYDSSEGDADIVVTLDQQMYPFLMPLIEKYARENSLKIIAKNGTCGTSAGMLSKKTADVGGFCCPPGMTDRIPGIKFHTVGIASLLMIIHPYNKIENITIDEARKIFMGDISRWSEVQVAGNGKGPNIPIRPVARLHCKLRGGHWRLLLDNEDLFSPEMLEVGAIPDMITQVASNTGSIGYETLIMIDELKGKRNVKILNINGYSPLVPDHVVSGEYPLYRVYSVTTWENEESRNPKADKLVAYLLKEVEKLENSKYLVPPSYLKRAGWKFNGNELIGEPEK